MNGTLLLLLLTAAWSCRGGAGESQEIEQCRGLGEGTLRRPGLSVHVGTVIDRDGTVGAGKVPPCAANASATALFLSAHDALERAPSGLRPADVVIHVDPELPLDAPRLGVLEVHQPSGSVLVASKQSRQLTQSMWLHELAHLLMLGDKPGGPVASRLFRAIEEAVADYYAAVIRESPLLGAGGESAMARDLRRPPRGIAAGWESLALPHRRFDEHRFGWDLATRFWRASPRVGPLVEDLVQCAAKVRLDPAHSPPRQVVRSLLNACPQRSRAAIRAAILDWLPVPLHPDN